MSERIEVERDGITIGWKLIVLVGVAVLGLYVSNIVAPLNDASARHEQEIKEMHETIDVLKAQVAKNSQEDDRAHKLLDAMQKDVQGINNQIIIHQEEHKTIWRLLSKRFNTNEFEPTP